MHTSQIMENRELTIICLINWKICESTVNTNSDYVCVWSVYAFSGEFLTSAWTRVDQSRHQL